MDESGKASDPPNLISGGKPSAIPADSNQPKQVMGFRDLVLFYVVTGVSLRWIATAAAAGPSSILIWVGAWLFFYIPLALSVIELSSRYPDEGGVYVWAKRAFGDFAGFITAWTYWACNLPYFPAVFTSPPAMRFISGTTGAVFPTTHTSTSFSLWSRLRWLRCSTFSD